MEEKLKEKRIILLVIRMNRNFIFFVTKRGKSDLPSKGKPDKTGQ